MTYRPAAREKWAKAAEKFGPAPVDAAKEIDDYVAAVKAGRIKTLPMPWPNLAKFSKCLIPGSVTMMYGTGGFGKSLLLLQLSYSLHAAGVPIRLFMLENDHRKHCHRLYCQLAKDSRFDDTEWIHSSNGQVEALMAPHREAVREFGYVMRTSLDKRVSYDDLLRWIQEGCDQGAKFFAIDPITHASQNEKPWIADPKFIDVAKSHIERAHAALVVVTHPTKPDNRRGAVAQMSGSRAFFDFTDCVLRLERPEKEPTVQVKTEAGSYNAFANRTIVIDKARNATGTGMRIGLHFDDKTFLYRELGLVLKDAKKAKENGHEPVASQDKPEDISNLFDPVPSKPKPWMERTTP